LLVAYYRRLRIPDRIEILEDSLRHSTLIFSTTLAVSAFVGIGASSAADLPARTYPTKAPVMVEPVYNWSGWYVGGTAGYGFGSNDVHVDPLDAGAASRAEFTAPVLRDKPKGFIGGVEAGWNQQVGQFVYGIEADISGANIRGSASSNVAVVNPIVFTTLNTDQQKLNWFGTFRGRVGVAVVDKSLIYATGGLAYGQVSLGTSAVEQGIDCTSGPAFCTTANVQRWQAGWTVGAGWEYAFASNWSAKIEYLYYDLGRSINTMTQTNGVPAITFQGSAENRGNIVRAGLNYHFNAPVVARY